MPFEIVHGSNSDGLLPKCAMAIFRSLRLLQSALRKQPYWPSSLCEPNCFCTIGNGELRQR